LRAHIKRGGRARATTTASDCSGRHSGALVCELGRRSARRLIKLTERFARRVQVLRLTRQEARTNFSQQERRVEFAQQRYSRLNIARVERPELGRHGTFQAGLRACVILHRKGGGSARANGPGFSFIPELIYGGRRISALPRGPRKWSASPVSLSHVVHCLPRAVRSTRSARIYTESYDLGSNFCESTLPPTKMHCFSYDRHFLFYSPAYVVLTYKFLSHLFIFFCRRATDVEVYLAW